MLLTYGGTQIERFQEALKAGTMIVCVNPKDVLSLDLDRGEVNKRILHSPLFDSYVKHAGVKGAYPVYPLITTSVSGTRKHMYIPLRKPLPSTVQYRDWAVDLGSDPEREKHSYERYLKTEELSHKPHEHSDWLCMDAHPWVLFETPIEFERVRKWYRTCGLKFQSISHIDPDSKTYDTDREGVHLPRSLQMENDDEFPY